MPDLPMPTRDDPRNEVTRTSRTASLFATIPVPHFLPPMNVREMDRWHAYIRGRHPTDWQLHDLIALHELVKLESRYAFVCESYDLQPKYIQMDSGRFYAHPAFAHMVRLGDMIARRRALLGFTYNVSRDALERFGARELEQETEQRAVLTQQEQQDEDLLATPMNDPNAPPPSR